MADDGVAGSELWKSDGTADGTVLVSDVNPGGPGSQPAGLCVVGTVLFFAATNGYFGRELWRSDGTTTGTRLVTDIVRRTGNSFPSLLTPLGSILLFVAQDRISGGPGHGPELWRSDGFYTGTVLVKDLVPGTGSPFNGLTTPIFMADDQTLLFSANDGVAGMELWRSDGTDAGTVLVKDIMSGPGSGITSPASPALVGATLYFAANDGTHGQELWRSDGTEAGTVLVKDIAPGS